MLLQDTHFRCKDIYRLKVKGWKKILYTNGDPKGWNSYTYIRQKHFQTKTVIKSENNVT